MSPDNSSHLAQNWRLNSERLKLQGCECPDCLRVFFPPKAVCTRCFAEIKPHPMTSGTITAILENSENDHREIEVAYTNNGNRRIAVFSLNGLSHSARIEINMPAKILSRKSSTQEDPILSLDFNSLSSK